MRGHSPLIAMRRAGAMPHAAWLFTDPVPRDWTTQWPLDGYRGHVAANIAIETADNPATLDLRMLVGLPMVFVHGDDPQRVQAVFDAAVAAQPQRVIGACSDWIIDSQGVLEWRN